jgi:hypothetical protein
MAVVEVDDGVKEATGGSEQHGVGERGGLGGGIDGRHAGGVRQSESIVMRVGCGRKALGTGQVRAFAWSRIEYELVVVRFRILPMLRRV